MTLRILPLGVGDAFSALHYGFSIAVGAGDAWILVDCPHPLRKMLREASERAGLELDIGSFEALVLTHLHADHSSGVESFAYFTHFALGRPTRLVAHDDVVADLWDGHLRAGMKQLITGPPPVEPTPYGFDDYFEHVPLREDATVEVGPFRIACRRTIHHIPTTALRIEAAGRSVGISADTAFDEDLIAWLGEADLVVHETNHGPAHTPYERLAALPAALRAKMRLVHYPDELDLDASAIAPLREGELVVV